MAKPNERPAPAASGRLAPLRDPLRAICLLVIGVSLCVSFARLLSVEPLQSANDRSRWCTVWSLVEQGTYKIDDAIRRASCILSPLAMPDAATDWSTEAINEQDWLPAGRLKPAHRLSARQACAQPPKLACTCL